MSVQDKIEQYKHIIIFLGLAVGGACAFNILPTTTEILTLKENVKLVYLGTIALAGYTFYNNYYSRGPIRRMPPPQNRYPPRPPHQTQNPMQPKEVDQERIWGVFEGGKK